LHKKNFLLAEHGRNVEMIKQHCKESRQKGRLTYVLYPQGNVLSESYTWLLWPQVNSPRKFKYLIEPLPKGQIGFVFTY